MPAKRLIDALPERRLKFIREMDARLLHLTGSKAHPKIVRVISEGEDKDLADARVGALAIWALVKELQVIETAITRPLSP